MLIKQPKFTLIIVSFLLLGFLLGLWIGIDIKALQTRNNADTQRAIRVVTITIDPSQREDLFTRLREFADKWRYAIRIAPLDPIGENFSIQLWRSDMNLSGLYPNDPGTLDIGFFYTNPERPVPEQHFDEEINDLRHFIYQLPGATFTVK